MATLLVNDKERRIQYIAAAAETNFTYDWSIFVAGDLDVFNNELLLVLGTDYTVTGVGVTDGGEVVLNVGADLDDSIVIVGDLVIDQTVDFTIKANFTGTTVQTQFNKLTMIAQELDTKLNQRALLYNVFDPLKINRQDSILPQLSANQIWQMNSTNTGIFAAELEVDPGANTLRSELISNQSGSDGAKIVGYFSPQLGGIFVNDYLVRTESKTNGSDGASVIGYFDAKDSLEKTVKAKLDELGGNDAINFKNIIIGGDFTTNPFQRRGSFAALANDDFPADRFKYQQVGSMVLRSMIIFGVPSPSLAGIFVRRSLRFEVTTGTSIGVNDLVTVSQNIEGFNWTRIAQRKFTVSFFIRSSITGTLAVAFRNTDKTISWVTNVTITSANSWEKKSITIDASPDAGTWNYETGVGIEMSIVLAAGTNFHTVTPDVWDPASDALTTASQTNFVSLVATTVDIALFQIEEGEIASSFEVRLFPEELALCQRYFYKSYSQSIVPGAAGERDGEGEMLVQSSGLDNTATQMTYNFPVTLRENATSSNTTVFSPVTGATGTVNNITTSTEEASIFINGGDRSAIVAADSGGHGKGEKFISQITINAEL